MRAGPGTPRDPKTHLFVTNRVAIPPFLTSGPGFYAEFRRGSRQGGPTPSISTFFFTFFGMIFGKMPIFGKKTLESCLVTADFRPAGRPAGALGPHGAPWGPMGPHGAPWGPMGPHGAPRGPVGPQGPGRPAGRPEIRRDQARFQGFFTKNWHFPKNHAKKSEKKS